jgi:hypothetical protein
MSRKPILRLLFLLLVGLVPCWASAAINNDIKVTLEIVDEQGHKVPYVTVWGYLLPRADPLAINAEDLWRLTTRYQSSFEFATENAANSPVSYLMVFPMGDEAGRFMRTINYRYEEGSAAKLPEKMMIGFTLLKHGYLPARIDFTVKDESALSEKVVLKRDPKQAIESQPYLVTFERLRYELSDQKRNVEISEKNHERMEHLRTGLEAAAQQALEAGDKKAAARIYARMQYLPSIRFIQGKPAGFSQAEPYSEQSLEYLAKAYELDPANSYIAAEYLFHQGAMQYGGNKYIPEKASEEQRRNFSQYLEILHVLMRAHGEEIWPTYHELYALWLRKSSNPHDRERVVPLLEELYSMEPKFQTREILLQIR